MTRLSHARAATRRAQYRWILLWSVVIVLGAAAGWVGEVLSR